MDFVPPSDDEDFFQFQHRIPLSTQASAASDTSTSVRYATQEAKEIQVGDVETDSETLPLDDEGRDGRATRSPSLGASTGRESTDGILTPPLQHRRETLPTSSLDLSQQPHEPVMAFGSSASPRLPLDTSESDLRSPLHKSPAVFPLKASSATLAAPPPAIVPSVPDHLPLGQPGPSRQPSHPPSSPQPNVLQNNADEALARAAAMLPPSPPRRNLRTRKAQQLNPYTIEAMRYQRSLIRNDWQDAVVSQREWSRMERQRIREEREREQAATEQSSQPQTSSQSQWLVPDPEDEAQEATWRRQEERDRIRKEKEARKMERSKQRERLRDHKLGAEATKSSVSQLKPDNKAQKNPGQKEQRGTVSPSLPDGFESSSSSTSSLSSLDTPDRNVPSTRAINHEVTSRGGTITYGKRQLGRARDIGTSMSSEGRNFPGPLPSSPTSASSSSSEIILPVRKQRRLQAPSVTGQPVSDVEMVESASLSPRPAHLRPAVNDPLPTFTDSSADEMDDSMRITKKTTRSSKSRHQGAELSSSSDSTDYERRFRQLKKMMPAGMARRHIEDLRAMRHGKAYHSDGHISSTPTPSECDHEDDVVPLVQPSTPNTSPLEAGELRPGEARKRIRTQTRNDEGLFFEGDPESDSAHASSDTDGRSSDHSSSDADTNASWWVNRAPEHQPRESDAIDRMLSRASGNKHRSRPRKTKTKKTGPRHHQDRLDGHLVPRMAHTRPGAPLRELPTNASNAPSSVNARKSRGGGHSKRRRTKTIDPRVGSTKGAWRGPAGRGINPPVVRPRVRPRLDLIHDDVLFDFQIQANGDEENMDDYGEVMSILGEPTERPRAGVPSYVPSNESRPLRRSVSSASSGVVIHEPTHGTNRVAASQLRSDTGGGDRLGHINNRAHDSNELGPRVVHPRPIQAPSRLASPQKKHLAASPRRDPLGDLRSPKGRANNPHSPSRDLELQRAEAEMWDDHEGLRVDFGIRPPPVGIRFDSSTYLGKGRLHELLGLTSGARLESSEILPSTWIHSTLHVGHLTLRASMSIDETMEVLPSLFEALAAGFEPRSSKDPSDGAASDHHRAMIEEATRFLCLKLTAEATNSNVDMTGCLRLYRAITGKADLFVQHNCIAASGSLEIVMLLRWFRLELCWRLLALCRPHLEETLGCDNVTHDELANCSHALMLVLFRYGMHQTMKQVKAATAFLSSQQPSSEGDVEETRPNFTQPSLTDLSAELWICLIHLLERTDRLNGGESLISFWGIFEGALRRWQRLTSKRGQIVSSESTWYCIFGVCSLSYFSASMGVTLSLPHVAPHWSMISETLGQLRLRFDETVEANMSFSALAKRDQYVRVLLRRCYDLVATWGWRMEGAELALSKLFEIFNSHKLADLPSESDHDFAPFLRDFDEGTLWQDAGGDDSCFHILIKLLARAGRDLRGSASDARDGDRRISRLFSRITPIRVMSFTRSNVPTSGQRSMLFNHYALVMLYLYLVPSQAHQRLRQIRGFLAFKEADFGSQLACIRAVMYAAVIFRHHRLDLAPITSWFGEVTETLMHEYEVLEKTTGSQVRRGRDGHGVVPLAPVFENAQARQAALRRQNEVARLIIAVLRSLQHVIQHPRLGASSKPVYPELDLLHKSWTKDLLEAQVAIDPAIGNEALKCIQTFLLQRNQAVERNSSNRATMADTRKDASKTNDTRRGEESQDSFGDLFDDDVFDFEDPALESMLAGDAMDAVEQSRLGWEQDEAQSKSTRALDGEFCEYARTVISPALFRLVSNMHHPDRRQEGLVVSLGVTERLGEDGVGSGHGAKGYRALIKEAERRQYLERVIDCWAGCAHVMVCNGQRSWESYVTYGNESWKRIDDGIGKRDVGLRFLQNMAVLDAGSVRCYEGEFVSIWFQTAVCRVLSIQHTYTATLQRCLPGQGIVSSWGDCSNLGLEEFEAARGGLLRKSFRAMGLAGALPVFFGYLSGMLSAMRAYVDLAGGKDEYLAFCLGTLDALQEEVGEHLLRGVAGELGMTRTHVERGRAGGGVL